MEKIKLDLVPSGKMPSLHASQYDDGRDYHIDLTENRVPYVLDGTETISLTVRKCDNTLVTMDIANTFADKSYIEFRTTEQMNACAGFNYGEITLEKNGDKISSLNFYLQVEGAPDEGGITSQSEINNLNRQIDDYLDETLPDVLDDDVPPIVERVIDETLAPVAKSGNYDDLNNKPSVAVIDDTQASASKVYSSNKVVDLLDDKASASEVSDIRVGADGTTYASAGDAVRGQVDSLKNNIEDVETNYGTKVEQTETDSQTTNYQPDFTSGYMSNNGSISSSTTLVYSVKIPVQEGDSVGLVNSGSPTPQLRMVCAFYNDNVLSDKGSNSPTTPFVVPSGVNFVVVTTYVRHNVTAVSVTTTTTTTTTKYYPITQPLGKINWRGNLNAEDVVNLMSSNVRFNVIWSFACNVSTMGELSIGINHNSVFSPLCKIDSEKVYFRTSPTGDISSESHGLTINKDLRIEISSNYQINRLNYIKIFSGESEYIVTSTCYGMDMKGAPCVVSNNSILTNCSFSWIPQDINKPIWVFGDSWVSMFETRWVYYMQASGFNKNWMLNGFAGETTQEGLQSLKNLLLLRKPDYVVWLYGMNDGDTSSAVNSAWLNAYNELMQICHDYKITPILYTVPTTPSIINTYKNQIVRNSGHRYIDCVSAMGADENGNWTTGYQSQDGNHTTNAGAKALYNRILCDFPEIAEN